MKNTDDERADERERAYIEGSRMAWRGILSLCLRNLDNDDVTEQRVAALTAEREDVRSRLRELCREFGDNDWPDNLHLADVIDKHLAPYLREREQV